MILQRAYIISWLGNKDIARARLEMLKNVVSWCKDKNLMPCIIAMEWEESWYSEFVDADFIKVPFKMPPGHARNIGLNHLYSTEDDFGIFLDDDTYIETGEDLVTSIQNWELENVEGVDVITVIDPEKKDQYVELDKYHRLRGAKMITSGVFIVKNIRKYYPEGKDLWFSPHFVNVVDDGEEKLIFGEDVHFGNRAHFFEYGCWECVTSIANMSRLRTAHPSTWSNTQKAIVRRIQTDKFDTLGKINNREFAIGNEGMWADGGGTFHIPEETLRPILRPKRT